MTHLIEVQSRLETLLPRLMGDHRYAWGMPEKWMIFLDSRWTQSGGYTPVEGKYEEYFYAILNTNSFLEDTSGELTAHEMAHLMHNNSRAFEEDWVKEGVATLIAYLVTGDTPPGFLNAFSSHGQSVVELDLAVGKHSLVNSAQYGVIFQYFHFLYSTCGGEALLEELVQSQSQLVGVDFVESLIKVYGSNDVCGDFNTSFREFQVSRYTQDPTGGNLLFAFHFTNVPHQDDIEGVELSSYSTLPYYPKESGQCIEGDEALNSGICLRIVY